MTTKRKAVRRRATAPAAPTYGYTISADALVATVQQAHETTNRLMAVQFENVKEHFQQIHQAMADVKFDLQRETAATKLSVEQNRSLADERHIGLVKKIWWALGVIGSIEIAILVYHTLTAMSTMASMVPK